MTKQQREKSNRLAPYRVSGRARTNDGRAPTVAVNGVRVWEGIENHEWQSFDLEVLAPPHQVNTVGSEIGQGQYIEFDNLCVTQLWGD